MMQQLGQCFNENRKRRTFIKSLIEYKGLLLFVLPGFIVVLINNYLPMLGVIMAFKRVDNTLGILKSPFVGLDNFKFLFMTDAFRITRNTVLYNLVGIFIGLLLNLIIAITINELLNKFLARVYQTVIILPYFLSFVVIGYIVYAFLSPVHGFVNFSILPLLGMDKISWYTEPIYWIFILPLVNFWVYCGMESVIYLAAITGIDETLYESAVIDGANKRQQIVHITLPMLTPVMIVLTLLGLGKIFRGNFGLFYQVPLSNAALFPVTDVIDTYVYRSLVTMPDFGMVTAASVYQSVVGCIMLIAANMLVKRISPQDAIF